MFMFDTCLGTFCPKTCLQRRGAQRLEHANALIAGAAHLKSSVISRYSPWSSSTISTRPSFFLASMLACTIRKSVAGIQGERPTMGLNRRLSRQAFHTEALAAALVLSKTWS